MQKAEANDIFQQTSDFVDDTEIVLQFDAASEFRYGRSERLSTADSDITYSMDWYPEGYRIVDLFDRAQFRVLQDAIASCVETLVAAQGVATDGFSLAKYHRFVTSNEQHLAVVAASRDLFPADFKIDVKQLVTRIGENLGLALTDIDPLTKKQLHIIVRINRPRSNDYNPPHKDIYEMYDQCTRVPPIVNIWIPICGVGASSSLAIAPKSHLLTEDKILRSREGIRVNGNPYRVRNVKEWDGEKQLVRMATADGQALIFTPHLIHGCGYNEQGDTTRVALEFRLFKQD